MERKREVIQKGTKAELKEESKLDGRVQRRKRPKEKSPNGY